MRQRLLTVIITLLLHGLLAVFVVVPFLRFNQLLQWDTIGHLFASWHIREHLFPAPTGWNPYFFAGFPQGTFYPPLFHWTVASLSFLMPLKVAFKLLVSLAVLATPFTFYWYARSLRLSSHASAVAMALMTALLTAPIVYSLQNNNVGGTLSSTFYIGLVVNALALPLLFLYAGSIHRFASGSRSVAPSIILALLILTHLYTAATAVVYFLIYSAVTVRTWAGLRSIFVHAGLTFLLSVWWVLPFLVQLSYSATARIDLVLGSGSFILIIVGLALVLMLWVRERVRQLAVPVVFFVVVTIGILLLNFLGWQVHIYRLVLVPILLVPIFLLRLLPSRWHVLPTLMALGLIVWGLTFKGNDFYRLNVKGPQPETRSPLTQPVPVRTFLLSNPGYQSDIHTNQHRLPMEEGAMLNKGLFVESSKTSSYLLTLERMLDPNSMAWGVPFLDGAKIPKNEQRKILADHLRRFGFQAVVAPTVQDRLTVESRSPLFSYPLNREHALIEFNGRIYAILLRQEPLYFAFTEDTLVLVENDLGFYRFVFFNRPELPDRATLVANDATYYVNRLDEQVLLVDFRLREQPEDIPVEALRRLQKRLVELPPSLQRSFEADLAQLQDELEQSNIHYAQAKYQNFPTIELERIGEVQVRADRLQKDQRPQTTQFSLYTLPPTPLVEPLTMEPEVVSVGWEKTVDAWFLSLATDQDLVRAPADVRFPVSPAVINNLTIAPNGDRLAFTVAAEQPTPILVKMSYFPKWRATADGVAIPIHQAAPNLMVIMARGNVELTYRTLWYEYLACGLTVAGLLTTIALAIRGRRENRLSPRPAQG